MRTGIRSDIPQVDDIFGIETLDEGGEALSFVVADGQHQHLDPRRGGGYEGVESHYWAGGIPG